MGVLLWGMLVCFWDCAEYVRWVNIVRCDANVRADVGNQWFFGSLLWASAMGLQELVSRWCDVPAGLVPLEHLPLCPAVPFPLLEIGQRDWKWCDLRTWELPPSGMTH